MNLNKIEQNRSGNPIKPEKVQDVYDATSAPEGSLAYLAGEVAEAFAILMQKRADKRAEGDAVRMYDGN